MVTTSRAVVKVTLGWEVAYEFEVWIMPHHAGVDLILGTDFMIPAGIRLDLYNSAVKLPDEMVIPLIRSSNAPTKTEFGPNVPCGPPDGLTIESRMTAEFKLPRRQPILANEGYVRVNSAKYRDWQILAFESAMDKDLLQKEQRLYNDWLSHQPPAVERRKYPTPTAVERRPPPVESGPELTCAERWRRIEADAEAGDYEKRRGNADVISTSAVTRGDPAINSAFKLEDVRADRTSVLHDGQDGPYQLSKFEDDGAISDVKTNSAIEGTSEVRATEDVSATEDSAITEVDLEERSEHALCDAQPVADNRAKFGIIRPSSAAAVNSAMGTPEACITQSAAVDSASGDLNTESASDVGTACGEDASYTEDAFACTEVSSAVTTNSAVDHSDATKDYDNREVLLPEGIKPNDDPATADSALETMEAETGSEVVRQHDNDTIYLGDKFEHAGVRSAIAVNSANTGPDADDTYDLSEVSLLRGTGTEIGVTSSATMVLDPGGIGYRLEHAVDEETASQKAGHVSGTDPKTVTKLATAELNWEDDECNESLKYLAPPSKNPATVRMSPELLYARIPADFAGCVLSFDGSAKTAKYGGYGSCSWILWRLPNWDIEIAASAYLSSTTFNIAEYTGMNNGVLAAIDRGITDLIIVGDSRLAIQQFMGVIACKKETLQVELARHKDLTKQLKSVRYRHIARHYNAAADSLATEALEAKAGRVFSGRIGKQN
ncbi:hypothetical protein PInf_002429 [Phytophthora infestans]|nr:hypothetical protein PInf_002429 [Phytophthora infestans]